MVTQFDRRFPRRVFPARSIASPGARLVPSLHRLRDLGSGVTFLFVLSFGLLAYTWLGYPALVRLFAWMRKPTVRSDGGSATVTVVIASRDDDYTLIERLRNVAESDYPRECLEAVVALDAARTSSNLAASLPDLGFPVTVVQGDLPGGKAGALNAGVHAAHGDTLVFTDSAQRFTATTIGRLASALAGDVRLGAVSGALHLEGARGGRVSVAEWYWRYERWLRYWEARLHSAVGVTGAVYAMRRSLWTPLPAGLILDDLYTPMQLILGGHRVGFVRDATGDAPAVPVRPVRGQLLHLAWRAAPLAHVLWGARCYMVPWQDGTVLVGATVEEAGFAEDVTVAGVHTLLSAAAELVPDTMSAHFKEARVGLRPATTDTVPVIGPSPEMPGLFYATGHYRNGILLAPLTAVMLADGILEGRWHRLLDATSPARFHARDVFRAQA